MTAKVATTCTMTCTQCGANITGNVAEVLAWDTNHSKECNA